MAQEDSQKANGDKKTAGKFTDPCLLIDYIREFGEKSKNEYNQLGWSNFKVIETDAKNTPADIISSMTSRGGLDEFLNMDNTTIGLLVPKVRLYKQYYESENDVIGKSLEYLFDDSFDADRIDAMTLSGLSRSGGAGIQEVSWEFNGTNPAEAERVISVSMKLVFQSAYDLLGDRYSPDSQDILAIDPEQDFIQQEGGGYTKNYIDLILHPPSKTEAFGGKSRQDELGDKYVPKFYRLKMVVGWAVPDGVFPNLRDQPSKVYREGESPRTRTEKLKEELRAMELSIFLNLVSHQLNIRENGQIELSIDYIGSFEETINGNAANVLVVDRKNNPGVAQQLDLDQDKSDDIEDEIDSIKRNITDLRKKIDCLDLSKDPQKEKAEEIEKDIKKREEKIKELKEEAEEFDDNSKSIIYKQFLERLNSKVRSFTLTKKKAETWLDSLETNSRPEFTSIVGDIKRREDGELPSEVVDAINLEDSTFTSQEDEVNEAIEGRKEALEDLTVNYVYFGDILDLACELANPQYNKEIDSNMRILTGPVMLRHPRGDKVTQMNLADVPISFDDFQIFFFETVVRKELASYPLRSFIKDVLERLVRRVLQPRDCFAKGREQRIVDIGMTNFTIRSSVARQMSLHHGNLRANGRFVIDPATFNFMSPSPAEPDQEYNCLLLYMTSYASYDLRADEIEDRKKGIYHYYIGAETGLIQKIEFSRSDVQGLREARQAESRNLGQIRDVYNANVRMIGNTLYIPGMKVFLNPPIGFGRPESGAMQKDEKTNAPATYGSLANLLGIGGYYDVIKVQSTISRNSVFSTELDCVFAQSGAKIERLEDMCSSIRSDLGFGTEEEAENG